MKGIETAKKYFEIYGSALKEQFPDIIKYMAFGICGQGSECLGYDNEISKDHDFEPGFCVFLPDENFVDRKTAFLIERAYSKLPAEFDGLKRSFVAPAGGNRRGVLRISEFFEKTVGSGDGRLSLFGWLNIPEQCLLDATNGEIFEDNFGLVTEIRQNLKYFPRDVMYKKLARGLLVCGQAGQYNYARCVAHGELSAAQLAVFEFVKGAVSVIFLLNRRHCPFYKWSFRALRELETLGSLADSFDFLMTSENDGKTARLKSEVIDDICKMLCRELLLQGILSSPETEAERAAYEINSVISDPHIRELSLFA